MSDHFQMHRNCLFVAAVAEFGPAGYVAESGFALVVHVAAEVVACYAVVASAAAETVVVVVAADSRPADEQQRR